MAYKIAREQALAELRDMRTEARDLARTSGLGIGPQLIADQAAGFAEGAWTAVLYLADDTEVMTGLLEAVRFRLDYAKAQQPVPVPA